MNTPGVSNGVVQLWYDGVQIVNRTGLYIRKESTWKINEVRFGSNYSNGGSSSNPNPYPDPMGEGWTELSIDEVVISKSRIGCL